MEMTELLARWNSDEGKPYKGMLIDWEAYEADPDNIGCMCAQGQVLSLAGGWNPQRLRNTDQTKADSETAKLLNISRAHAILLRNVNDNAAGAPSIVLTHPGLVLGDQWSKLLDFWWMFHCYEAKDWKRVVSGATGRTAAGVAGAAAGVAAGAARVAAAVAGATGRTAAGAAAEAAGGEIQGFQLPSMRGRGVFFLPMFGINSLDDIPPRPADYGNGLVPACAP